MRQPLTGEDEKVAIAGDQDAVIFGGEGQLLLV